MSEMNKAGFSAWLFAVCVGGILVVMAYHVGYGKGQAASEKQDQTTQQVVEHLRQIGPGEPRPGVPFYPDAYAGR